MSQLGAPASGESSHSFAVGKIWSRKPPLIRRRKAVLIVYSRKNEIRAPRRIDPAKNSESEDDANNCNQRFGMQHPGRAETIVHPAVGRGHVNNGKVAQGRERRVFGGSSAAANGEQDDRGKGGVSHSTGQGVGKNADGESVWGARRDSHDNRDYRNKNS